MADFYSSLQVSPRKKRCPPELDETEFTPKRLRTSSLATPSTAARKTPKAVDLASHLSRLHTIQNGLQHALSHALASCAVSPTSDTGIVRNVLNHLSLQTYTGLTTQFSVVDLRRLCWLWEWDGKSVPKDTSPDDDDDNPFLETETPSQPKEWSRGAMGFVLTSATHHSKVDKKRVPAYGIGIEVEMDIDKDMGGGMAAVARWTAAAEQRKSQFHAKLVKWQQLHENEENIPLIPLATLPELSIPAKPSALTRVFASLSPKATGSFPAPSLPGSPSKSPTKRVVRDFAVPFPITPSSIQRSPTKNSILFPQTPSRRDRRPPSINTPTRTPTSSNVSMSDVPSTPVHQRGSTASTVPQTPTSSRRQALYERVRQRSLTSSPTKTPKHDIVGAKLSREQMLKLGQEEMRRRCLLGRLPGVAESVWMMFAGPTPTTPTATPTHRKRRALPLSEVASTVIKSSPIPISMAEATESLEMLTQLCPFFLKPLTLTGEEWLEMPKSSSADVGSGLVTPSSPGSRKIKDSAKELLTRSPKRVKREGGGLREVREIIRRELELDD
ncbi:hypothetical protein CPB85DRAFT_1387339 [Mucidula mucida]|nr:hypothetical protein CPB85DRAFT_1387339 [Mucidula mucida]